MSKEYVVNVERLLIEECSELIHILSKIDRYGIDSYHPDTGVSNRERLVEEIGDVLYLIEELDAIYLLKEKIEAAKKIKAFKLKKNNVKVV